MRYPRHWWSDLQLLDKIVNQSPFAFDFTIDLSTGQIPNISGKIIAPGPLLGKIAESHSLNESGDQYFGMNIHFIQFDQKRNRAPLRVCRDESGP